MIIDKYGLLTDIEDVNCWENSKYSVWWEGIVFVGGLPSGKSSIEHFIRIIEKSDIASACNILSGSFSCILLDREKERYYAFVDNSCQSHFFYNQTCISTSFLKLIDKTRQKLNSIDHHSVVEFVITGNVFTKQKFFKDIKIIDADEIFIVSSDEISVGLKNLSNIYEGESSEYEFLQNLRDVALSLKNNKISMDLTGGSDSRLLTVIFREAGIDFETAVSGMSGHPDIEISKMAAGLLGTTHYVTYHKAEHIDLKRELEETFINCDGLSDVLDIHRLYQFDCDRGGRGITLAISGGGGELYKDGGWWRVAMQSLFNPTWDKTIVKKLVDSGLAGWGFDPNLPSLMFAGEYREICLKYKDYLFDHLLRNYRENNRFKMADKIFYEYSVRSPREMSCGFVKRYSPLLDRQIVPFGINMDKRKRFLSASHRNIITALDRNIARLKTAKADTCLSSELNYVINDMIKFFTYVISAKLKRARKQPQNQNGAIFRLSRRMKETHAYINSLKEIGMLDYQLSNDDIPDKYLGRLITLGKLIERLK